MKQVGWREKGRSLEQALKRRRMGSNLCHSTRRPYYGDIHALWGSTKGGIINGESPLTSCHVRIGEGANGIASRNFAGMTGRFHSKRAVDIFVESIDKNQ